jgi:hypothetical protein
MERPALFALPAAVALAVTVAPAGFAAEVVAAGRTAPPPAAAPARPAATAPAAVFVAPAPSWKPFPGDDALDVAALVAEVKAKEAWIDAAHSFHFVAEGTWTRTPRSIAALAAEYGRSPGVPVDEVAYPELRPTSAETIEVAFDGRRVMSHRAISGQMEDGRAWDGTAARSVMTGKWGGKSWISQVLAGTPDAALDDLQAALGYWPRAYPHRFWFQRTASADQPPPAPADEFRLLGRETFRGIACYVLQQRAVPRMVRWYVGVDDHLLHRIVDGYPSNRTQLIVLAEFAKTRGKALSSIDEALAWAGSLPPADLQSLSSDPAWQWRTNTLSSFSTDFWYLDYADVLPGRPMPRTLGYTLFERDPPANPGNPDPRADDEPWPASTRTITVKTVTVNTPLPDALFHLEFVEGAPLQDQTRTPMVEYPYRKNMTPEELRKIVDDARAKAQPPRRPELP